jgi:hypothetical protein
VTSLDRRANIDGYAAGVAAGVYLGVCGDGNDLADQLRTRGGLDGLRAGRPALPGAVSGPGTSTASPHDCAMPGSIRSCSRAAARRRPRGGRRRPPWPLTSHRRSSYKSALAAAMIGGGAVAIRQGVGVLVDVVMTHR